METGLGVESLLKSGEDLSMLRVIARVGTLEAGGSNLSRLARCLGCRKARGRSLPLKVEQPKEFLENSLSRMFLTIVKPRPAFTLYVDVF